jgi:outer membrane protein TolC
MKAKTYKELLIIFIALGSWIVTSSQQYPDSLQRYIGIAAKNNPAVLQKFNEYKAALQKVPQAGSLSDPELSIGIFLSPMELVSGKQVADIRLMQMFPWFGVLKSAKDEMSLMANAKYELFRDAKQLVFYDVQRTWYELYKVQKNINISEKNIEILKTIERLAIVRFKAAPAGIPGASSSNSGITPASVLNNSGGSSGMQSMGGSQNNSASSLSYQTSPSMQTGSMGASAGTTGLADLYRIQIEAGDLEINIALMKSQQRTIVAKFNSYLNRPPATPVAVAEKIPIDSLRQTLTAVSDSMLANNPMLGMLEYEKQSFEAHKKMVSRMGYPMVGAGINYSVINRNEMSASAMNGKDMIMPMVVVTLPVYRKKYNSMQAEAEFGKTATSMNYESIYNSLQNEYYQAVQLYEDAQRRIELYKNQSELANRSLDLMLKSFSVSASGLTEVLRVRQQTLEYELKQIEAVTDFNTAVAWLRKLGNLEN